MGKTRDTGKLATQIQFDNNNNLIIGSSPSSILDISGSIEAGSITGSVTGSVFGIGDTAEFSSSVNTRISTIQGVNTFTSSTSARLNAIETVSASNISRLGSIETFTSSTSARLNAIETVSASNISRLTAIENKTGSLATTGSNTFIGTQVITGSLYITTDLIVQGSSSIQNITGSSVNIGTNKVVLNTANPAVRYAGISVIDSGSTGLTGSILWDSTNNNWLYQNPSGSGYTSAKFISGPQSQTLGGETGLNTGYIPKAVGDDHIGDSMIFESGSRIGLGTTQPNAMIHTTGSIWITDNPGTNSLIFGSGGSGTAKYAYITSTSEGAQKVGLAMYTTSNAGTSNQERLRITDSGYIGIGTTAPANKLEVFDTQTTIPQFQIKETSSAYHRFGILKSGSFVHFVEPGNDGSSTSEYLMTINMNGNNVGIGTNNPSQRLEITSGHLKIATNGYGLVLPGAIHTSAQINFYNASSETELMKFPLANQTITLLAASDKLYYSSDKSGIGTFFTLNSDGNIGIGTLTPSTRLTVAKPIDSSAYGAGTRMIDFKSYFPGYDVDGVKSAIYSGVSTLSAQNTHGGYMAFMVNQSGISGNSGTNLIEALRIEKQGFVGIGTTNPGQRLHVSGNIYSTDTVFARNLNPNAFAGPSAGSPTGAGVPAGYSSMTISSPCDNQWRALMTNLNDTKGYFWVTLGDAASKDTANYFMSFTSPAYGVSNFGLVSYQDNGWNTGGFEFTYDSSGGSYRLLVRCTSYYSSSNIAYGTIYFLRIE